MRIKYDYSKLEGRIIEILGSRLAFYKLMGWSARTGGLKLNQQVNFKQEEIIKSVKILKIPFNEIHEYFFKVLVQRLN